MSGKIPKTFCEKCQALFYYSLIYYTLTQFPLPPRLPVPLPNLPSTPDPSSSIFLQKKSRPCRAIKQTR